MSVPDLNFGLSQDAVKFLRRKEILSYSGDLIQLMNFPFKLEINLGMYEANPFTEDDIRILLQKNFTFTGNIQFMTLVNRIKVGAILAASAGGGAGGAVAAGPINFGLSQDAVKFLRRKEILSYSGEFIQLMNPPFKLEINLGMYEPNPFTEDDIRILLQKNFTFTGNSQFMTLVNRLQSGGQSAGGGAGSGGAAGSQAPYPEVGACYRRHRDEGSAILKIDDINVNKGLITFSTWSPSQNMYVSKKRLPLDEFLEFTEERVLISCPLSAGSSYWQNLGVSFPFKT